MAVLTPTTAVASARAVAPAADAHAAPATVASAGEPPCTFLPLEGDTSGATDRLSGAIGRVLARRGLDDGRSASLPELRLALGCDDDAPACIARGGTSLGSQRMLYGKLTRRGEVYTVALTLLDVASASVIRSSSSPLDITAFAAANVDATADTLVFSLFPALPASTPAATATADSEPPSPATTTTADTPRARERRWIWGADRPAPRWKVAALATSASVSAVLLAALIGTSVTLNVTLPRKLRREVDASDDDDSPNNDVSPSAPNLCAAARARPPGETDPKKVTNAKVTEVCNQADGLGRASLALLPLVAVGLVSTTVFTVLMFGHRVDRRPPRRVSWRVGAAPGHVQLGLSGRF